MKGSKTENWFSTTENQFAKKRCQHPELLWGRWHESGCNKIDRGCSEAWYPWQFEAKTRALWIENFKHSTELLQFASPCNQFSTCRPIQT